MGIDRAKMRLYDCEQSAQNDLLESKAEEEYNYEDKPKKVIRWILNSNERILFCL